MSRSKTFLYNSMVAALLQIVTVIAGFIIPRVMLTVYGSEINGLVASITQFVAYFRLVEAGLAGAAVYSLYKPLAESDVKGINAILSAARRFYNQSGYIFTLLVLCLAFLYPWLAKSDVVSVFEMIALVLIIGFSGSLEFFVMAKYRVLLTADQKVYVLSMASICSVIFNFIIIVMLAQNRVGIVIVRAIAVCSVFLRSFILHFYVKFHYKNINYNEPPNNKALKKRWDALYLQILGSIHTGAPVIIATLFTNLKVVSIYSIYNMVLGGISGILSVAINGLFASFGDVIARGERNVLQRAYEEFELIYYMIISWAYGCAMVLIMPFIKIYTKGVSDIQYDLPLVGFLFVMKGLMYNIKTPQGMMVISAGLFKETRVQTSIQGGLAVILGIIFAQFWGLPGILCGSILSDIYRDIDLLFFIPRNVTKLQVKSSFYRIIRIFICIGISNLSSIFIKMNPNSYSEWFKVAIPVSLFVAAVVVFINTLLEKTVLIRAMSRFYRVLFKK